MDILIAHGRDLASGFPATLERDWADALRFGLERVGAPNPAGIDVRFAFYGDLSAQGNAEAAPTPLQAAMASEILPVHAGVARPEWERLADIVRGIDEAFGAGGVAVTRFLMDLDAYFERPVARDRALSAIREACRGADGPILLMGQGLGSVVAYDLIATDGAEALGVDAMVTFGSPLGMASIRGRLQQLHPGTPFPKHLGAWSNVSSAADLGAVVRELADLFPSTDGRRIADVAVTGSGSAPGDPVAYLSSLGLAQAVAGLLRGERLDPGTGSSGPEPDRPTRGVTRGLTKSPPESIPAGATAAEAEPGTRIVERTASADFPPIVAPGSTHDLLFSIAQAAVHARATGLAMDVPVEEKTLELRVGVYAADFDVRAADDPSRTWIDVTVDLVDASARVEGRFKLTAHAVEERRETPIYLTVYRGNLPAGQLTLVTVIDPVHEVRSAPISLSIGGAPDPDYVLVVTDRSDQAKGAGPFDMFVSKEGEFLNKPLGAFPVTVDAWEYASRRLDGFRRVKDEVETADRIRAAEMLGVEMWNDLPEAFQRFYWEELHDRPGASIAIYSQEPYIPWELIKPQRAPGDADGFLGAVFNVARWKQATRFPDPLTVSRFSVIAPIYTVESGSRPLPGAQKEADELVARFAAVKIPGDRASVRRLLESEDGVQVVHFAGHGDFDAESTAAMTIIRLSDAPLVPGDLTQALLGRASRPFVFLNACEVGEQGWALTRIGGWAEAFTDVGFSGFIGPYWAVNDHVARKAAILFYHSLAAGLTVAEAVRQIRLRFYTDDEHAGHPSWLAYTLHSQPNIRVRMTENV